MTLPEYYENDVLFFFDGKPTALPLYQALFRRIESAFPAASVKVQKTQIDAELLGWIKEAHDFALTK